MKSYAIVPVDMIEQKILLIRGQKVMLDRDLAELYGVETRVLNQAVRRNLDRFPKDFMMILTREEILRISQIVISSENVNTLKFSKSVLAFTENGIAMLSTVLSSKKAIQVNIQIMRAFVRLREYYITHKELAYKLAELERKVGSHDEAIRSLVIAIKELTTQPEPKHRRIGFI